MNRTIVSSFILLGAALTLSPSRPQVQNVETSSEAQCAIYSRPDSHCRDVELTFCARCGDGVCDPLESCSSSSCGCIGDNVDLSTPACTTNCGPLHCPEDCDG
jgi:hypothetical protein